MQFTNFKDFLLKEETGLGDLGLKMDRLMNSSIFNNKVAGFLTSDWTGREQSPTLGYTGHALNLPGYDLYIPHTEKTGRIDVLQKNRNPIYLKLTDGTEAYFTWDEFKKIEGSEPQLGKVMTITFQRNPEDRIYATSKIQKAIIRD